MLFSVPEFVDVIRENRLLTEEQAQQLTSSLAPRYSDANQLARELIERGWITPYQANQIFLGRGGDLLLGSYVLLERLGKGGMANVYKARHRTLGRIVALKLIRKELLDNPAALMYFHREIRMAAQLDHANIVRAYDADAVDGVHFYTMEFVEGTTLSQLVESSGPLPMALACEVVRQTAVGLHYAFKRNIVHRDIKPANLMLTWTSDAGTSVSSIEAESLHRASWGMLSPLVKILDMGLARIPRPASSSSDVKPASGFLGTPDFIAPEQGVDVRNADIRSDLYSLGCTFYYLLTGNVPFPGGNRLEKVYRHQVEEPKAVERFRPEVPFEISQILRKLMAKKPDDRFQTPKELVAEIEKHLPT
ncbi:MAG: hypothetical protein KatS3mg105_3774 [Gemmatales bacterium]|nr:MAG: hypothetical protein KatS3mg105_3774 [Gemmatales bacterium]